MNEVSFVKAFYECNNNEKIDPFNMNKIKLSKFINLPKQIELKEFYNIILKSKYYEYLIENIKNKKDLYLNLSPIHGEYHANNVSLFALYISLKENISDKDLKTLLEACIYHDIGRISDSLDLNHGKLGAQKYLKEVNNKNINQFEVSFLIEAHALKNSSQIDDLLTKYNFDEKDRSRIYKLATIIRDSDALDRTRFRIYEEFNNLNINYLENVSSKNIILASQELNNILYGDYIKKILLDKKPKCK